MRIENCVYFSPNYKFTDLEWSDENNLVEAFKDRVENYYLQPARQLNDAGHAFASGVISVTTIDFLAGIQTGEEAVGSRIEKWLKTNLEGFQSNENISNFGNTAQRFSKEFRNGLVHEGRIKNGGQFSYEYEQLVRILSPVMIVNPTILVNGISTSFHRYMEKASNDRFTSLSFRCSLFRYFQNDIEIAGGL